MRADEENVRLGRRQLVFFFREHGDSEVRMAVQISVKIIEIVFASQQY
jgi:hypothetical protein